MSEVYYKCIYSIRAKLSPVYLILILVTFSFIVVSLPLFSSRSLFGIKKPVKYLFKPYLFTTQSDIALPDFVGMSTKLVNYSQVIFLMLYPKQLSLSINTLLTLAVTLRSGQDVSFQTAERKLQETTCLSSLLRAFYF